MASVTESRVDGPIPGDAVAKFSKLDYDPEVFERCLREVCSSEITSAAFKSAAIELVAPSRTSEDARAALAKLDVIKAFMRVLVPEFVTRMEHQATVMATIRCVGNACATDEGAREYVRSSGFQWVRALPCTGTELGTLNPEVSQLAASLVYNLFEERQACADLALQYRLDEWLIDILSSGGMVAKIPRSVLRCFTDMLDWIFERDRPEGCDMPREKCTQLLMLLRRNVVHPEHGLIERFTLFKLVRCVTNYFNKNPGKQQILIFDLKSLLWNFLVLLDGLVRAPDEALDVQSSEGQTLIEDISMGTGTMWDSKLKSFTGDGEKRAADREDADSGDEEWANDSLFEERMSIVWLLSDLATEPEFAEEGLEDRFVASLVHFLAGQPGTESEPSSRCFGLDQGTPTRPMEFRLTAACHIVCNVLNQTNSVDGAPLVQRDHIHVRLTNDILHSDHPEYLHATAGLLIHLARVNAEVATEIALGTGMVDACRKLLDHANPQLTGDGARLVRALGLHSPAAKQLYTPLLQIAIKRLQMHREEMPAGDSKTTS